MKWLTEDYKDYLKDETKAFAFLATTMADGTPQVTPVWFNVDGEHILINSAKGRVKDKNMRARPDVALVIIDYEYPEKYLQVRGQVVDITEEGGDAHINQLAHKYRGKDFNVLPGQVRTIYRILPKKVNTY